VLFSWAEAIAETLTYAPHHLGAVLDSSQTGAAWRSPLGLAELTPLLGRSIEALRSMLTSAAAEGEASVNALIEAVSEHRAGETELDTLVRYVLCSALQQRRTRQMLTDEGRCASLEM
jgi:hypothetical protein